MGDKRTLIAFLAIGAILLLLPYYYEWMGLNPKVPPSEAVQDVRKTRNAGKELSQGGPKVVVPDREPPGLAESGVSSGEVAAQAERPGGEPRKQGINERGSGFVPREIVIQTPLERFRFSTRGGALVGCELRKYRRVDGSGVELIPDGGRGLLVRIVGPARTIDLADTEFSSSAEGLTVAVGGEGTLRLRAALAGGGVVEKVMRFYGNRYGFDLEVKYQGLEQEAELWVRWEGGVAVTEGQPQVDLSEARVLTLFNGSVNKVKLSGNDEPKEWEDKGDVQWVGARSKYFLMAMVPEGGEGRTAVKLYGKGRGKGMLPAYSFGLGARATGRGSWKTLVYAGPLEYDNLKHYDVQLERAIDFGWPVVRQISRLLLVIFKWMHGVIPNYGWIIVIFALVIKLLVYPLTHKTYESTAKMQQLQPKIAALREKYGRDQKRLSKETMRLYKEEGVNPLGGCLPMVLQMPIFFALYNLFGRTIELRQAPFIWWIKDLSIPEAVSVAGFDVRVLPILMGIAMLFQQKMTMKDPKQAMLVYLMPAMMIFVFWRMSSGLVLYWTVFNVLTIAQQVLVSKLRKGGAVAGTR